MRHLNYNHLMYFWTVAREGSIAKASEVLHLTPQTISSQLKLLEESVNQPLFQKKGRGLRLTDHGMIVKQYADEIFTLGLELTERVRGARFESVTTLKVGLVETLPKIAVEQFLNPAFELDTAVRLICQEGNLDALVSELATHQLDIVLSDRPMPTSANLKVYNHALGESPVALYVPRAMRRRYSKDFPNSLNGAPLLLPFENSPLRRAADEWLMRLDVLPSVIAECSDSALIKAFATAGRGLFVAPLSISDEIERVTNCVVLAELDDLKESFFAISANRKIRHPAVVAIAESARSNLF